MRRSDREVSDISDILGILQRCDVCHLGLHDEPAPYIVPLNFGYEHIGGALHLYFHCAQEGKKLELLDKNPNAFFQMDCGHRLVADPEGCASTMEYECVMGAGIIKRVEDFAQKKAMMGKLMEKYGMPDWKPNDKAVKAVCILELVSESFTAKRLKK